MYKCIHLKYQFIYFGCNLSLGASCEDGWFEVEKICFRIYGNHTYLTWDKGRDRCLQQGGDLAIVDSEIKRQTISRYLTKIDKLFPDVNIQAYIGIRKLGIWQWIGGRSSSGNIWHRGYPHVLVSGECAALVKGFVEWKLFQTSCFYLNSFVCETHESKYPCGQRT